MATKKELTKKKLNGFITDHHKQQLRLTNKQFSLHETKKKVQQQQQQKTSNMSIFKLDHSIV